MHYDQLIQLEKTKKQSIESKVLNKRKTVRNSYCSNNNNNNNNNLTPDIGTPVKGPDFCKNKTILKSKTTGEEFYTVIYTLI